KVVGEPFKPKKPEEIPTGTVTSRDVLPEKKDTSLRFSPTADAQTAEINKTNLLRKVLPGRGKTSLKAAAGALASTTALQTWGDPFGWTDLNYTSADDCGKEVGDPPGRLVDNGAGSGNHQFTAPILNLAGRGLDLPLALTYNSRVWHKASNDITFDIDRDWPAPGFSLGFGKISQAGLSHGFMVIDGDGTRHPFSCSYASIGPNNAPGMKCFTIDGTFIDYEVEADPASYPIANTPTNATLKMPDGTVITYGATGTYAVYPTRITDPNGNYITIGYVGGQGPRIDTITDTVGRVITFHYDSMNPTCLTAIKVPDFSTGTTRTLVRLNYTDLTLSHGYNTGNPVPKVRATTFKMIKAIYYPATATGYWFGDANSYSLYGMLTRVSERRGMGFDNSTLPTSPGNHHGGDDVA
ncbi:MAG: hypothetical protein HOP19_18545, partial [Acidobacteria bacterium]|nr:hypothetical protein [Acidobacteriota bacterium]